MWAVKIYLFWSIVSACNHIVVGEEKPPDRDIEQSNKVINNKTCTLLGEESRTPPMALAFCDMFRADSCCDPAIDVEIQGYYDDLVKVSELCGAQRARAHIALQYIFCYACSPKEPEYTNNNAMTITLCSGIAEEADPKNFDDCGLVVPGERGVLCSGDDVIIPSLYYGSDRQQRLEEFFNDAVGGMPPYFEDYTVKICDPTDAECEANCYKIDNSGMSYAPHSDWRRLLLTIGSAMVLSILLVR